MPHIQTSERTYKHLPSSLCGCLCVWVCFRHICAFLCRLVLLLSLCRCNFLVELCSDDGDDDDNTNNQSNVCKKGDLYAFNTKKKHGRMRKKVNKKWDEAQQGKIVFFTYYYWHICTCLLCERHVFIIHQFQNEGEHINTIYFQTLKCNNTNAQIMT